MLMKELWLRLLSFLGIAYWVEITTSVPRCTYYFGPFVSRTAAEEAHLGYLEDLKEEGAQGIAMVVKQCKPGNLTIFDEAEAVTPTFQTLMSMGNS